MSTKYTDKLTAAVHAASHKEYFWYSLIGVRVRDAWKILVHNVLLRICSIEKNEIVSQGSKLKLSQISSSN